MRNYNFSMESILDLRERTEKEEMEVMARIQNKLEREKMEKSKLEEERSSSLGEKARCRNFEQVRYYDLYIDKLLVEIRGKDDKIEEMQEELDLQRSKLVEAQKDRKIMEKLREKEYEKHVEEIQRREQMELDEIAVLKFNGPEDFA